MFEGNDADDYRQQSKAKCRNQKHDMADRTATVPTSSVARQEPTSANNRIIFNRPSSSTDPLLPY
ncbi:hypothetical protein SCA6_016537 [Theobroma cacao]